MDIIDNHKLRVDSIVSNYKDLLFRNPNIVGFGRGVKVIDGNWTDTPCLTIYVKKKLSSDNLDRNKCIPKYFNGVLTDIAEAGGNSYSSKPVFSKMAGEKLFSGSSVGNNDNSFGGTVTCGFLGEASKGGKKQLFIFGCATALARINSEKGSIGNIGDVIVNPAKTTNRIGVIVDISPLDIGVNKQPSYSKNDSVLILLDQRVAIFPGFKNGDVIKGTTKTVAGVKAFYEGAASGRQTNHIRTIKSTWRHEIKDKNGHINIIEYSGTTTMDGKYNAEDRGAMGFVQTMSKENLGFGMLVAGTEKTLIFTDLEDSINYFKDTFKLELIK